MQKDPLTSIFTQNYHIPIKRGQFFKQKTFDIEHLGLSFYQRITTFALFILVASIFCLYSFLNIMYLVLKPSKFIFPYCISLLLYFNSLGFVFGFKTFYSTLMKKKKRLYTVGFMVSTVFALIVTMRGYGYFVCAVAVIVQVCSFIVFVISFVPGGSDGLGSLVSMAIKR